MGVDNSTTSDIGDHLELFRGLRQIAGGCLFCGDIGDPVTEVTLLSERSILLLLQPELPLALLLRGNLL